MKRKYVVRGKEVEIEEIDGIVGCQAKNPGDKCF